MSILVTGGLGYIGSHVVYQLLQHKYQVVIIDNLSNSTITTLDCLRTLVPTVTDSQLQFHQLDIRDREALTDLFAQQASPFQAIIHLAGLKSVPESLEEPELYFQVNVTASQQLIRLAQQYQVPKFIFSGSATVYGGPVPTGGYRENQAMSPEQAEHMYGESKRRTELLMELAAQHPSKEDTLTEFISLRYFNPVGNHPSGLLGENITLDRATNLLAMVARVYCYNQTHPTPKTLSVYGNDYPDTPDGTCQRDFIHVMDLAVGHVVALNYHGAVDQLTVFNLGTGQPVSVQEILTQFQQVAGVTLPTQVVGRRPGDLPVSYANVDQAQQHLGWQATHDIATACQDLLVRCHYFLKEARK